MLTNEEKKKALTNPSSVFKIPADVIACKDLDKTEKAAILKQWELDARQLQVATEEGMTEGERSLFAEVKKAQEKLGVPTLEAWRTHPRRGWRADQSRPVGNSFCICADKGAYASKYRSISARVALYGKPSLPIRTALASTSTSMYPPKPRLSGSRLRDFLITKPFLRARERRRVSKESGAGSIMQELTTVVGACKLANSTRFAHPYWMRSLHSCP